MATNDVRASTSPNREFAFRILKHVSSNIDEAPRYTIGIWEGSTMHAICHVSSKAGAFLALSAAIEGGGDNEKFTISYPRWSEICGLVRRLGQRADTDCIAAARYLEDFHAQLHNATAHLEGTVDRLTRLGALIEEATTRSHITGETDLQSETVAVPHDTWFRLLATYRHKQEGFEIYRELRLLREIAGITAETLRTVDNWLGHAGTRESAMEALWRLRRSLESVGYHMPADNLEWRGQIIRAMEEAGIGLGEDGALRLRQSEDKYWEAATGAPVKEILQNAVPQAT